MKIIQIGPFPDNDVICGGVAASVYGISSELAKKHDVKVISFPCSSIKHDVHKTFKGISVTFIANRFKKFTLSFLCFRKYIKAIEEFNPDIVHIHETIPLSFLILLYLKFKKKPAVLTIHGIIHLECWKLFKKSKSLIFFIQTVFFLVSDYLSIITASNIIVDTEYVASNLSSFSKKQFFVIPQGVEDIFFNVDDKYRLYDLISIASISSRKGHEYLIKSVNILKTRYPDIKLNIYGALSEVHKPYYETLLADIEKYNLSDNIAIHIDKSTDEIIDCLVSSNIYLLHSFEESQGIAICEAMAAGKPVVATNVGGIPFVVEDGVNGFLSSFGDVKQFSDNIAKILNNNEIRTSMSASSREKAKQYNWASIADRITKIYSENI